MIITNNVSCPEDSEQTQPHNTIENPRTYLTNQCYEGSKWISSLTFEGSTHKQTCQQNVLQYIGNPCYKDKKEKESYRIYFDPSKYPVDDEWESINSLPKDASYN